MKKPVSKKGQGEIFGIALLFVVIIVGVLIYSQVRVLEPDTREQRMQDEKYRILAQETMLALRKLSTDCSIGVNRNSIEDLMRFCIENSFTFSADPDITCAGGVTVQVCSETVRIINNTLQTFFSAENDNGISFALPFRLQFYSPDFPHERIHNITLTNMHDFGIDETNYTRLRFLRISSGAPEFIPTQRGPVEMDLWIYYR